MGRSASACRWTAGSWLCSASAESRLAAKNGHNAATIGLYLLVRYLYVVGLVLAASWTFGSGDWPRWAATFAAMVLSLAFTVVYFVLVERAVTGFRPLEPRFCSIYQAPFWRHERFWKVPANAYQEIFNGTPFKGVLWRLLGVRIGRRVFDDGCAIVERTLVSVGSDCTLGAGSIVQSHSMEDGTFKSDYITIGTGCTIGTGAFVHYGTTMGDGSVLDTDAFLMKGEQVPPRTRWRGNPATEVPATRAPNGTRPASADMRSARTPIPRLPTLHSTTATASPHQRNALETGFGNSWPRAT
jgi:non-ribosomal peptide synthetase-like protein